MLHNFIERSKCLPLVSDDWCRRSDDQEDKPVPFLSLWEGEGHATALNPLVLPETSVRVLSFYLFSSSVLQPFYILRKIVSNFRQRDIFFRKKLSAKNHSIFQAKPLLIF